MATTPIIRRNLHNLYRVQIASGAGNTTLFFPLDPAKKTSVMVIKNSETATISVTTDQKAATASTAYVPDTGTTHAGAVITDLEAATVAYFDVSSDTADYFAGDNASLSGIKVNSNPSSAAVEIAIIQF